MMGAMVLQGLSIILLLIVFIGGLIEAGVRKRDTTYLSLPIQSHSGGASSPSHSGNSHTSRNTNHPSEDPTWTLSLGGPYIDDSTRSPLDITNNDLQESL